MSNRIIRKLEGGVARARNTLEWAASRALRGEGPWCRNRWGRRYRAMSLQEYHYVRDGNPETHEAALVERLLRPGMTVVDVGANHGLFTFEALEFIRPGGRLHSFEPAPATRELFEANLRANGVEGEVLVFGAAVGAESGEARLRVHDDWSGLNTLAGRDITWLGRELKPDRIVTVPVVTLDAHASEHGLDRIDFLKIDVEGFELDVLRGARGLLDAGRIGAIMLEVGDVTCTNAGVGPESILEELMRSRYTLRSIRPDGGAGEGIVAFPRSSFSANFLAAHDWEPVLERLATSGEARRQLAPGSC